MSTAVGVLAAVIVGVPALRVRGLLLAVDHVRVRASPRPAGCSVRRVFTGSEFSSTTPPMRPPVLGPIDFADRRTFYYLCLVVPVRDDRDGRAAAAHRYRPVDDRGARQRGDGGGIHRVVATRMKLVAFAMSGGMAAFAGLPAS